MERLQTGAKADVFVQEFEALIAYIRNDDQLIVNQCDSRWCVLPDGMKVTSALEAA
ncbi:hypothetical protein [Agrobacterium sp. DE0009]|uniref:hypothetical protein n=1 Tax=Agrobacterium sp. DE0009 TaxID=2587505 RepID=UPI00164387A6|nr:hypothetical protein [Agrobacterium sp. DE0009]